MNLISARHKTKFFAIPVAASLYINLKIDVLNFALSYMIRRYAMIKGI